MGSLGKLLIWEFALRFMKEAIFLLIIFFAMIFTIFKSPRVNVGRKTFVSIMDLPL